MTTTKIMQRILLWGGILAAAVAVVGGVVGWFLAAGAGVASALVGTALAIIFCMLTAGSILLALKVSKGEMVSGAFFGIVLGGWQMGRAALVAQQKLQSGEGDVAFFKAKIATARFFADHVLSGAGGLRTAIVEGAAGVLALEVEQF